MGRSLTALIATLASSTVLAGCADSPPKTAEERDRLIDQILERSGAKRTLDEIDHAYHHALEEKFAAFQKASNKHGLDDEMVRKAAKAEAVWAQQFQAAQLYREMKKVFAETVPDKQLPAALREVSSPEWARVVKVTVDLSSIEIDRGVLEQTVNSYPPDRLDLIKRLAAITGQNAVVSQMALMTWLTPIQVMEPIPPESKEGDEEKKFKAEIDKFKGEIEKFKAEIEQEAALAALKDLALLNSQVANGELKRFVEAAEANPTTTSGLRKGLVAALIAARQKGVADLRAAVAAALKE